MNGWNTWLTYIQITTSNALYQFGSLFQFRTLVHVYQIPFIYITSYLFPVVLLTRRQILQYYFNPTIFLQNFKWIHRRNKNFTASELAFLENFFLSAHLRVKVQDSRLCGFDWALIFGYLSQSVTFLLYVYK